MRTIAILALAALASGASAQSQQPGTQPDLSVHATDFVAQQAAQPAAQPQPAAAAAPAAPGQRWPRAIAIEQGTLTVYQPQLEKLEGVTLSGRCATSWQATGAAQPVFGVFWFDARVLVDKDARTMHVEQLSVTKVRFPNVTPEKEKSVAKLVETEVPRWDLTASLDDVQAAIAVTQRELKSEKGLSVTPPRLIFSNDPAVLLLYDGEPVLRAVEGTSLERVVNTPLWVVRDPAVGKVYLTGGKWWYEAPGPKGPFTPTTQTTGAVSAYYQKNPPPPPPAPEPAAGGQPAPAAATADVQPRIVVATEPTELVVFDGKPSWAPVGREGILLYADNSDGRVLVHTPTSETYVLVSGRWYKAASLAGPWTPVRPDRLPEPFRKIPPDSPIADVRAFVTGTDEASDALADAQIPQTAAVKRDQTIQVTWDGEPKFKKIEGTKLGYGVNTPFSVIVDDTVPNRYWCCHQGVWYAAQSPKGPWAVSDKRPPSIEQVPASAPVYNTKYVYVYQATPEVVYVGYLPGYTGAYPYYGTVVYGTGYYYPPYIGPTVCYPYPATWGVHMSMSPWGWSVGVSYGTPFFSVGIHFGGYYGGYYGPHGYYPPRPPPYGYRPPPPGYRPPPGGYPGYGGGYRPPPAGGYPGGGAGGTRPPPQGAGGGGAHASTQPARNIYNQPGNAGRNAQPGVSNRQQPTVGGGPNNVYGDKNGNVYRQNQGGGWDKNTGGGNWQNAGAQPRQQPAGGAGAGGARASPQPASYGGGAPANLNRDAAARNYGGSRGGGGYGGGRGGGGGGGRRR